MGEVTTASDSLKTTCTSKKKKNDAIQLINTILQIKQQERVHRMQEVWLVRTSWVVAQGYMLYQQVRCPKFTYLVPLPSLLFWYGSSQLMRRHHFLDIIDGNQMNYLVEETGLLKTQDEEIATDVVQPNILNYIKGEEQDKKFYPKKILDYKLHTSPKDNTSWFNFSRKYWDYGHPIALENYSSTVSWSWIMLVGGVFAPLTIAGRAVPKDKYVAFWNKCIGFCKSY